MLEIRDDAQPAHDDARVFLAHELHEEAAERLHDDLRLAPEDPADHVKALLHREERGLLGVDENRDEHAIENVAAPPDEIDVAVRHGIERARVDGGALHARRDCTSPRRPRNVSPRRRAVQTSEKSASAGGRTHHQAPGRRLRASASARPQDAAGGGAPSPRNDSAGLRENGRAEHVRERREGGRERVREDVDEQKARRRGPGRTRRVHERLVPQALRARAHEAGRVRPARQGDEERRDEKRRLQEGRAGDHEDERRKGLNDLEEQQHGAIGPRPGPPGERSERRSEPESERGGEEACRDGEPRAVEDAGEDVAAELVRAEEMLPARRREPSVEIHRVRIERDGGADDRLAAGAGNPGLVPGNERRHDGDEGKIAKASAARRSAARAAVTPPLPAPPPRPRGRCADRTPPRRGRRRTKPPRPPWPSTM